MSQPATNPGGKSGLRQLKAGEVLFNDGEEADSLFIIQKGQLRLYKPKGKGFIEIAVLRTGEVIGEMAYFDEDGSGRKRSCSAAAMTPTEVIEISFTAFNKTMNSLNPWFKTIINTLATRLRKTNLRIKELESNSTASYGAKAGEYEFFKNSEVIRLLGTLFLVYKSHGERSDQGWSVHKKTLDLYANEVFSIPESKMDTLVFTLRDLGLLSILDDADKNPYVFLLHNLDLVRSIFIFYNTEKHLPAEKRMRISANAELLLEKILEYAPQNPLRDIANQKPRDEYDPAPKFTHYYNLSPILQEFKTRNIPVNADHIEDARTIQVSGERVMADGEVLVELDLPRLQRMFPIVKFANTLMRFNREKAGTN